MNKKEEAYKFYKKFKAKPSSVWEGATFLQKFCCEATLGDRRCGYQYEMSYSRGKTLKERWEEKGLSGDCLHGVMCPAHRKQFRIARTKHYTYANMSEFCLFKLALKGKNKGKCNKHFCDNVHYNEMLRRKNEIGLSMVDRLNEHLGKRRLRPELANYTVDDWRAYLQEQKYFSKTQWKKFDSHAQKQCYDHGVMDQLTEEFFSTKLIFKSHNDKLIQCQSYAELVFAKVLDELKLDFDAHPKWPFWFKNEAYKSKADFSIKHEGKLIFVEIWMLRRDLVTEADLLDKYVQRYLKRREEKEVKIRERAESVCDIFLSVEARRLRNEGLDAFLIDIKKSLTLIGISDVDSVSAELFSDIERSLFKLHDFNVEDLLEYAKKNNYGYYTQFDNSLERLIRKDSKLLQELELVLAKEFKRAPNSRYFIKPKVETIVEYVSARKELHSKESYTVAFNKGELPGGFTAVPMEHYLELKNWGQLWGEPLLVGYSEAKKIVKRLKVKGKSDFTNRRAKVKKSLDKEHPDYNLLKVRSNPGNRSSGGYDAFTFWDAFTGNFEKTKQRERNNNLKRYEILVKSGDIHEIVNELLPLNCISSTDLRKKIGNKASNALTELKNIAFIELILFGSTSKPIKDLNAFVNYVPESAYATEDTWRKQRKSNIKFLLFPAKLYRYVKAEETVGWNEVRRILKAKSNTKFPVENWFSTSIRLLEQLTERAAQ